MGPKASQSSPRAQWMHPKVRRRILPFFLPVAEMNMCYFPLLVSKGIYHTKKQGSKKQIQWKFCLQVSGKDNDCEWELSNINFSDFSFRKENATRAKRVKCRSLNERLPQFGLAKRRDPKVLGFLFGLRFWSKQKHLC